MWEGSSYVPSANPLSLITLFVPLSPNSHNRTLMFSTSIEQEIAILNSICKMIFIKSKGK